MGSQPLSSISRWFLAVVKYSAAAFKYPISYIVSVAQLELVDSSAIVTRRQWSTRDCLSALDNFLETAAPIQNNCGPIPDPEAVCLMPDHGYQYQQGLRATASRFLDEYYFMQYRLTRIATHFTMPQVYLANMQP